MLHPPPTRPTLLARLRDASDDDAWRQSLDLYAPVIYRLYRRRGLQDADAADLTQEVLQAVAMGAERFDYDPHRGSFRGWLDGVARNKLADYFELLRRDPQRTGDTTTREMIHQVPAEEDEGEQWEAECLSDAQLTGRIEKSRSGTQQARWIAHLDE